jgi:hypothetical protein
MICTSHIAAGLRRVPVTSASRVWSFVWLLFQYLFITVTVGKMRHICGKKSSLGREKYISESGKKSSG